MKLKRPVVRMLHCWHLRWAREITFKRGRKSDPVRVRVLAPANDNDGYFEGRRVFEAMRLYFEGLR